MASWRSWPARPKAGPRGSCCPTRIWSAPMTKQSDMTQGVRMRSCQHSFGSTRRERNAFADRLANGNERERTFSCMTASTFFSNSLILELDCASCVTFLLCCSIQSHLPVCNDSRRGVKAYHVVSLPTIEVHLLARRILNPKHSSEALLGCRALRSAADGPADTREYP